VSPQALARTWRPKSFDAVVGQDHVVKGLTYALLHDRLHHAYLFTGSQGVGKTTLARIFAKCLSCEAGVSPHPCGTCSACLQIDQGSFFDLIEIDAASRTKVEDTRELLDNVQYAPTVGRFKIYLIDEVHMLSTHSFNALLKTLEEPPSHVKFLLATTDPQKLPVTVLSRCLQYHLRTLTHPQLLGHLKEVAQKEGISFHLEALSIIAFAAKGSARDGLSLLDQAIGFSGGDLREDLVSQMLGVIPQGRLYELAEGLASGDANATLLKVDALKESWIDFDHLLKEFARFWQECALAQVIHRSSSEHFDVQKIHEIASALDPIKIQFFYQICLSMQAELSYSPDPFSGFEMAILRMFAFRRLENLPRSISSEERLITKGLAQPKEAVTQHKSVGMALNRPVSRQELREEKSQNFKPELRDKDSNNQARDDGALSSSRENMQKSLFTQEDLKADWRKFVESLKLDGIVRQVAVHTSFLSWTEQPQGLKVFLAVDRKNEGLLSEKIIHRLASSIGMGLSQKVVLEITASDAQALNTPAKQVENESVKREEFAHQTLLSDVCVHEIQEAFSAQVDTKTVELIRKQ
jgi:DNA polymerase-3 subunit gamma/tau